MFFFVASPFPTFWFDQSSWVPTHQDAVLLLHEDRWRPYELSPKNALERNFEIRNQKLTCWNSSWWEFFASDTHSAFFGLLDPQHCSFHSSSLPNSSSCETIACVFIHQIYLSSFLIQHSCGVLFVKASAMRAGLTKCKGWSSKDGSKRIEPFVRQFQNPICTEGDKIWKHDLHTVLRGSVLRLGQHWRLMEFEQTWQAKGLIVQATGTASAVLCSFNCSTSCEIDPVHVATSLGARLMLQPPAVVSILVGHRLVPVSKTFGELQSTTTHALWHLNGSCTQQTIDLEFTARKHNPVAKSPSTKHLWQPWLHKSNWFLHKGGVIFSYSHKILKVRAKLQLHASGRCGRIDPDKSDTLKTGRGQNGGCHRDRLGMSWYPKLERTTNFFCKRQLFEFEDFLESGPQIM